MVEKLRRRSLRKVACYKRREVSEFSAQEANEEMEVVVAGDYFVSVETNAEYENWRLQELEQRKDNLAQDNKRIQAMAMWSDRKRQHAVKIEK